MRIKILILGNDPASIVADGQLLRDRGMLVFTSFNLQNIKELFNEIRPDVLFFDALLPDNSITDTCNQLLNNANFNNVPVIFTLSEDDVYLVTRARTDAGEKTHIIADNIVDAVKMALRSNKSHRKAHHQAKGHVHGAITTPAAQLSLPIYFR